MQPEPQTRRQFLASAAASAAALAAGCRTIEQGPSVEDAYAHLSARPGLVRQSISSGYHELGLDPSRDGFFYVPSGYSANVPAPLLVLLHGGSQSDTVWRSESVRRLMDERGIVLLAPESGGDTWDFPLSNIYGPDVEFIDKALALVFDRCSIRADAITMAGFSDGASEALGLGVINGDLFSSVMAFSPGSFNVPWHRGTPRVFVSHGTLDPVLEYRWTQTFIVGELRRMGLAVEFVDFVGGHTIQMDIFGPAVRKYVG